MDEESTREFSDRIAKLAAKDRILSFHDGLVPAYPEHYAMLHGIGGKSAAPKSVIRMLLTDSSGASSVSVKANIEPYIVDIWADIAKRNMGTPVVLNSGPAGMVISGAEAASKTQRSLKALFAGIRTLMAKMYRADTVDEKTKLTDAGTTIRQAFDVLKTDDKTKSVVTAIPYSVDYELSLVRVNPYKKLPNEKHEVSALKVVRFGYRPNGEIANMPWRFEIRNFYADMLTHDNGTITYRAGTEDKSEEHAEKRAAIMLSDSDLYMAAQRVSHYVKLWEFSACTTSVLQGLDEKERRRQERKAQFAGR